MSHSVNNFLKGDRSKPITIEDQQYQKMFNDEKLIATMDALHPFVNKSVTHHHQRMKNNVPKGKFPNFWEGDFVLVVGDDFFLQKNCAYAGVVLMISSKLFSNTCFQWKT